MGPENFKLCKRDIWSGGFTIDIHKKLVIDGCNTYNIPSLIKVRQFKVFHVHVQVCIIIADLHHRNGITLTLQVKIVDRAGKMVPFGSPGELWCRGYVKMLGYYNQDSKTAEMIGKDAWIKTG